MTVHANQPSLLCANWRAIGACATAVLLMMQSNTAMSKPMREIVVTTDRDYENADGFRRTVHFHDLDVSSPDGLSTLNRRVWSAARSGCNRLYRSEPITGSFHERNACARIAVADARPQIDRMIRIAMTGTAAPVQVAVAARR